MPLPLQYVMHELLILISITDAVFCSVGAAAAASGLGGVGTKNEPI